MNDELKRALRPVKNRIRRNRFLRGAAAGLAAGLAAAVLLQAAAFFMPVPDRGLWAAAAAAAVTLLAAAGNAARAVKDVTAAQAADGCGLQERAVTAIEPGDGPIRELQRRDACEALKKLDVKKIRPGSVKKTLPVILGCAVLLGGMLLVPSPQDGTAASRKALNRTLQQGRDMIEQAAEEDEKRLADEKQKSELRKITADLDRELRDSRDAADALVALDRAEQRLDQLRQQTARDAAAGAAGDSGTGDKGNSAGSESREPGSGDNQTADGSAAANAAGSAAAGQLQTLQALTDLKNLVNPSLQAGNGTQANGGQQGNQAGQTVSGMSGNSGQTGQNGAGMSGAGTSGKTGSGAGEGSTNEEQQGGQNGSNSIARGNRDPKYKEGQYETIYDPERLGKERQDMMTEQNRTSDEGSVQIETGPGQGNTDGYVPWGEALQEYAETEARAADRENLTVRERQWVSEYYRLLTEQR